MTDESLQLFIEAETSFVERRRRTNTGNKHSNLRGRRERRAETPSCGSKGSDSDQSLSAVSHIRSLFCNYWFISLSTMFISLRWGVKGQQATVAAGSGSVGSGLLPSEAFQPESQRSTSN